MGWLFGDEQLETKQRTSSLNPALIPPNADVGVDGILGPPCNLGKSGQCVGGFPMARLASIVAGIDLCDVRGFPLALPVRTQADVKITIKTKEVSWPRLL